MDFSPYGYDERQFCSPGFDLAVGRLSRGQHGEYPEYHTSGDDLAFVDAGRVADGISAALEILRGIDENETLDNLSPYGEPQLGRRGLYSTTGGAIDSRSVEMAYLWVLSGSDGDTDLVSIAQRADLPIHAVVEAARRLSEVGLTAPRTRRSLTSTRGDISAVDHALGDVRIIGAGVEGDRRDTDPGVGELSPDTLGQRSEPGHDRRVLHVAPRSRWVGRAGTRVRDRRTEIPSTSA